jgi:hypothetical protein
MKAVVAFILMLAIASCSGEEQTPTHLAKINLPPSQYMQLVEAMDSSMNTFGVSRYGSGPSLKELKGRDVLFWAYQNREKSKAVALEMTDIITAGIIEIRAYGEYFDNTKTRASFIEQIETTIRPFGGVLISQK